MRWLALTGLVLVAACENGTGPEDRRVTYRVEFLESQPIIEPTPMARYAVYVAVLDRHGRPVAGAGVVWASNSGTLTWTRTASNPHGVAFTEWTVPAVFPPGALLACAVNRGDCVPSDTVYSLDKSGT